MNAIETRGLGKRYRRTWAVRDCDLTVPAGQVTALVGPNGAGKTTLLRILAGLATPTAGTATVLGAAPGSPQARATVSAMDQTVPLYRHLRVVDQLAAARALNDQWDADLAAHRLSALGMAASARVGRLSGGQQAQLALTMALARRPRLLLLDEPLASLDPLARQDVLGWLMTCVAEDGLSVVFSSHVIAELERVASYLVVLSAGRIQVAATVDSLLDTHLALTGPADGVDDLYDQVEIVTVQRAGRQALVLARTDAAPPGWAALPVLAGLFAGVPWVAREFESGAFRFTWTQGTAPRHWLLGTFGPLVLLAAVSAAIYGAAAYWWYQLAQWQDGTSIWSWRWSSFELTPLSIAGWTVLTMALALLCGVLIRRVLPAMIAFIVTLGACAYLSQTWLRPWLFGIGTAVKQVSWGTSAGWPPRTTTYTVQTWLQTPSGQRVSGLPTGNNVSAWIAQHHYTSWVAYQPHNHLIWLELARNGILITVAAFAVLASVWWLRIRPAD
jgi:ABC-2 type transport system ATP-binding protein